MSIVIKSSMPTARARFADANTPAAGPELTIFTGLNAASPQSVIPPDAVITRIDEIPASVILSSRFLRYGDMTGFSPASMTTVLVRSNSRISGETSEETDTKTPGSSSATIVAIRLS